MQNCVEGWFVGLFVTQPGVAGVVGIVETKAEVHLLAGGAGVEGDLEEHAAVAVCTGWPAAVDRGDGAAQPFALFAGASAGGKAAPADGGQRALGSAAAQPLDPRD